MSRFLLWARNAPAGDRAEAVSALARAYLYSEMSADDREQAAVALTAMLDDSALIVRMALAQSLGAASEAPRHLIVALAEDQAEVAEIVLARSPVLADCDLVDLAALGEERLQCAIAVRQGLSAPVAAALAEVGTARALATLARNPSADIPKFSLARMLERHGSSGPLREALLVRPDLPVEITQAIVAAIAATLSDFVTGCGWLSAERSGRVAREARERTTVALSTKTAGDDASRLVSHLRSSGQLTPALILRAVLSGATAFAETAFADLSGLPARRVGAILAEARGASFRALFTRCGLPAGLMPVFEAALSARPKVGAEGRGPGLCRVMIREAISACEGLPEEEVGRVVALLHRFDAEAARDEARRAADGMADQAALAFVLAHAPEALEADDLPAGPRLAA